MRAAATFIQFRCARAGAFARGRGLTICAQLAVLCVYVCTYECLLIEKFHRLRRGKG